MKHPLSERIGDPDLLVGREKEFRLLDQWLARMPKRLGKSRVILARRKSGKTAIVQRIFNKLWSENGVVKDKTKLNIIDVRMREKFQRTDGKEMEIDVLAESDCGRTVLVEVKNTKDKTGVKVVRNFQEKTEAFAKRFPKKKVLPAFLSVGGFTRGAGQFCKEKSIGMAEKIVYFQK